MSCRFYRVRNLSCFTNKEAMPSPRAHGEENNCLLLLLLLQHH